MCQLPDAPKRRPGIQISLPISAEAGKRARQALNGWLSAVLGEPGATNARLAATELVTNAVRHSGLKEDESVVMTATQTDRGVHIEVEQSTPAAGAGLIEPSDRGIDAGGFGLRIVEELASGWGVDEGPPGRVWFDMDR